MIPVAILCGGLGARARLPINKCFIEVAGKPFILRIMEMFEAQGFTTFVLCRGTEGRWDALRRARDQLGEHFLLVYGDTYLCLDIEDFITQWAQSGKPMITAVWDGIDAGVNGLSSSLLDGPDLIELDIAARPSFLYQAPTRYHEVGTPEALEESRHWALNAKKPGR